MQTPERQAQPLLPRVKRGDPHLARHGDGPFKPHLVEEPHRRHVDGIRQRVTQGDGAAVAVVVVLGPVVPEGNGGVVHHTVRRHTQVLDGGSVGDDWLEGGAGLPVSLGCPVVRQIRGVLPPSYQGTDGTGPGIEDDDGRLRLENPLPVPHGGREVGIGADRPLGRLLRLRVERCVNPEAAAVENRLAVLFAQLLDDVIDEIRVGVFFFARHAVLKAQRLPPGPLRFFRGNETLLHHQPQHRAAAGKRRLRVAVRGIEAGSLGQSGKQGCLPQGKVTHVFVKVRLCRRADAPRALAEVDPVQIHFEDFVLGVVALELDGQEGLLDLPLEGPGRAEEGVPGHLLGDGAAALDHPAPRQVGQDRADNGAKVNTVVLVKPGVLRRQESLLHHRRYFPEVDREVILEAELREGFAGRVVKDARRAGLEGIHSPGRQVAERRVSDAARRPAQGYDN